MATMGAIRVLAGSEFSSPTLRDETAKDGAPGDLGRCFKRAMVMSPVPQQRSRTKISGCWRAGRKRRGERLTIQVARAEERGWGGRAAWGGSAADIWWILA